MKRAILTFLLLMAVIAGVCGAEAVLVPTLAVNTEDQVKGILPARPLYIPRVSKVVRGQKFELVSGVVNPEFRNGKLQLNGTLMMKTPDGKRMFLLQGRTISEIDTKSGKLIPVARTPWHLTAGSAILNGKIYFIQRENIGNWKIGGK